MGYWQQGTNVPTQSGFRWCKPKLGAHIAIQMYCESAISRYNRDMDPNRDEEERYYLLAKTSGRLDRALYLARHEDTDYWRWLLAQGKAAL